MGGLTDGTSDQILGNTRTSMDAYLLEKVENTIPAKIITEMRGAYLIVFELIECVKS